MRKQEHLSYGLMSVTSGDAPNNNVVKTVLNFFGGHADGTHDGAFTSRPMRFDHITVEPQQHRTAVNFGIESSLERAESTLRENGTELPERRRGEFRFKHFHH